VHLQVQIFPSNSLKTLLVHMLQSQIWDQTCRLIRLMGQSNIWRELNRCSDYQIWVWDRYTGQVWTEIEGKIWSCKLRSDCGDNYLYLHM